MTAPVPPDALAWLDAGVRQLQAGEWAAAEAAFRQATEIDPANAGAWHNLSVALRMQGQAAAAELAAREALARATPHAAIWLNLANVLYDLKRWDDAASAYRQSLALHPASAAAWCNLGACEQWRGRFAEAQAALERSLTLAPADPTAQLNYAQLLAARGQPAAAIDILQKLLATGPQSADVWTALGNTHRALGALPAAEQAYRRALELDHQQWEARGRLTQVLLNRWQIDDAEALVAGSLALDPASPANRAALGSVRLIQGQATEAVQALDRALQLEPLAERHSALLTALQYLPSANAAELLPAHRAWDAAFVPRPLAMPPPVRSTRSGPLRVGFVSADFARHPVAWAVLPLLEQIDRQQCITVCYSDRFCGDELTQRFHAAANDWRLSGGLTDAELADQIRRDEIDVLVDLMGHTGNRLLMFARRPAPLAVSWFGYVGTTGLEAMDSLIADRYHVPPGEEACYSEQILRLPNSYACYGPPADAPPVGPLPASTAGHITFGCFNTPGKLSPTTLDAFAAILRQVGSATLLLKYVGLDQPGMQSRLRSEFTARGVDSSRVLIEGGGQHSAFMAAYGRVDLALDTRPYSGGVTTCEALWMGVPVITCPGRTFAGRHATSYLTTAGLPQFVASSPAEYIELAVQWAGRLEELAALRAQLREQVRRSPLGDAPAFARDFVALLRSAWTARAAGG